MKDKEIEKLKELLTAQTDANDVVRLRKIKSYISYLYIDAQCDKEIQRDGTSLKIENGSQVFFKQHPAIETKLDIQDKIEKLESALGISSAPSSVEGKGGGLI